jgi:hypothetical protein
MHDMSGALGKLLLALAITVILFSESRGNHEHIVLYDLRFSQRWLWRVSSFGIWRRVVRWVSTDVSEELIASIFRVEEIGSANQRATRWPTQFFQNKECGLIKAKLWHRCSSFGSLTCWQQTSVTFLILFPKFKPGFPKIVVAGYSKLWFSGDLTASVV